MDSVLPTPSQANTTEFIYSTATLFVKSQSQGVGVLAVRALMAALTTDLTHANLEPGIHLSLPAVGGPEGIYIPDSDMTPNIRLACVKCVVGAATSGLTARNPICTPVVGPHITRPGSLFAEQFERLVRLCTRHCDAYDMRFQAQAGS